MRKNKRRMLIICVSTVCVAVAALTAWAADSLGWFTAKVELADIKPDSFQAAGLGSGVLALESIEYLYLSEDEQFSILLTLSESEFETAEEEFAELAAEVWISQSDIPEESDQEYVAVRLTYDFSYAGTDADTLEAYVRFVLSGSYANSIEAGNSEEFCLQNLSCIDTGDDITRLTRFCLTDYPNTYYYSDELSDGDGITLMYTLFAAKDVLDELDYDTLINFELIQVDNNASILGWNVDFSSDTPQPYDTISVEPTDYYPYEISAPDEDKELDEAEEIDRNEESSGDKEIDKNEESSGDEEIDESEESSGDEEIDENEEIDKNEEIDADDEPQSTDSISPEEDEGYQQDV